MALIPRSRRKSIIFVDQLELIIFSTILRIDFRYDFMNSIGEEWHTLYSTWRYQYESEFFLPQDLDKYLWTLVPHPANIGELREIRIEEQCECTIYNFPRGRQKSPLHAERLAILQQSDVLAFSEFGHWLSDVKEVLAWIESKQRW